MGTEVVLFGDGRLARVLPQDRRGLLSRFSSRWLSRPKEMARIADETLGTKYERVQPDVGVVGCIYPECACRS